MTRVFPGIGQSGSYTNKTGRNDIIAAKISHDATNIYFYMRTATKLTPATDPNWMLLFIDADHRADTGWLGYDFVAGRGGAKDGTTSLEKNAGGYHWNSADQIAYVIGDHEIELAVPRAVLGVAELPTEIYFKWADNIQQTGEATDFTLNGDSAPDDRFNYRARFK